MLPISEADPEIKAKVLEITGACCCRREYRDANAYHIRGQAPQYDPCCAFHQHGERYADLFRDNRRLKKALLQVSLFKQLKKDKS